MSILSSRKREEKQKNEKTLDEFLKPTDLRKVTDEKNKLAIIEKKEVIGHDFDESIPIGERRQFGQFYTPIPIADLIAKWVIRSPHDKILDPGCGTGVFLVSALKRLYQLKTNFLKLNENINKIIYKQILEQLYGIEINKESAEIAKANLSSSDENYPVNIIIKDYFAVDPFLSKITDLNKDNEDMETRLKNFDAVIGNPPYTRWSDISPETRDLILKKYKKILLKYDMLNFNPGSNPGIFVPWIIHSTGFLKEGGRLGMIITDNWLQTSYGIKFGNFLLDNYKIKAVIDLSSKIFRSADIGATILLLEKSSNKKERDENKIVFLYTNHESRISIDEILDAVENPEKYKDRFVINVKKQKDVPRDKKWINFFFDTDFFFEKMKRKAIPLGNLFFASAGNYSYVFLSSIGKINGFLNHGAKNFFEINKDTVEKYGLEEYAHPALSGGQIFKHYIFSKKDWEEIKNEGKAAYFFICHKPKDQLPKNVLEYIKWGETECRSTKKYTAGAGKICSETQTSKDRESKKDLFYGWYDLGDVVYSPIFGIRLSQYFSRFIYSKEKIVIDDAFSALVPKTNFTENELKALLSFLNSSFIQLQVESIGRIVNGGAIEFDIKTLNKFLILNVKNLPQEKISELASLFEKLEQKSRASKTQYTPEKIFGTELASAITGKKYDGNEEGLFNTVIKEIDYKIGEILGFDKEEVDRIRDLTLKMIRRRVLRYNSKEPELI